MFSFAGLFFFILVIAMFLLLTVIPIWSIVVVCSNQARSTGEKVAWVVGHLVFWTFIAIIVALLSSSPSNYRRFTLGTVLVFIASFALSLATGHWN